MKNIEFSDRAIQAINGYITNYREYYENLYEDSGIWGLDEIISNYREESFHRKRELLDTIEDSLGNEIITYVVNTTILRWRSKILIVSFEDEDNIRIITEIEIR